MTFGDRNTKKLPKVRVGKIENKLKTKSPLVNPIPR